MLREQQELLIQLFSNTKKERAVFLLKKTNDNQGILEIRKTVGEEVFTLSVHLSQASIQALKYMFSEEVLTQSFSEEGFAVLSYGEGFSLKRIFPPLDDPSSENNFY